MPFLAFKPTQRLRVLQRLLNQDCVMVYELMTPRPNGEGVAQYGTRLKELRETGYQIENVEKGKFVLHKDCLPRVIEKLRMEYKLSRGTYRDQVMAEGLMIKKYLEAENKTDEFYQSVKEALL